MRNARSLASALDGTQQLKLANSLKTSTLVVVVGCLTLVSCGARLIVDMAAREAYARGLVSVADSTRFPDGVREARDSLISDMHRRGEEPADYFGSSEMHGDSLVVFHLWHRSALGPSMRGANLTKGSLTFDAYFDRREQRMTARSTWQ